MRLKMRTVNEVVRDALNKEMVYLFGFCDTRQVRFFENQANTYGGYHMLPEEVLRKMLGAVQETVNNNFKAVRKGEFKK